MFAPPGAFFATSKFRRSIQDGAIMMGPSCDGMEPPDVCLVRLGHLRRQSGGRYFLQLRRAVSLRRQLRNLLFGPQPNVCELVDGISYDLRQMVIHWGIRLMSHLPMKKWANNNPIFPLIVGLFGGRRSCLVQINKLSRPEGRNCPFGCLGRMDVGRFGPTHGARGVTNQHLYPHPLIRPTWSGGRPIRLVGVTDSANEYASVDNRLPRSMDKMAKITLSFLRDIDRVAIYSYIGAHSNFPDAGAKHNGIAPICIRACEEGRFRIILLRVGILNY